MVSFIIKRLLQLIPVLLGVALLTFIIVRSIPGDPFANDRAITPEQEQRRLEYYGLDKPKITQFFIWLWHAVQLDLGPSFKHIGYSVNEIIAESFPASLELGLWSLLFAIVVGIPIGMYSALKKNSAFDNASMACSVWGICMPSFVLGPILLLIFCIWLGWFNPIGWEEPLDRVLPTLTLGFYFSAYIVRLTRAGFLEILSQDFIKSAFAKGLGWHKILWRHAFKGSVSPVVTFLGPAAANLLTGSFVVETIFFIPGLGRHFIEAAFNHDYGLLLGVTVFFATLVALFNLAVDIILVLLDPRQRI